MTTPWRKLPAFETNVDGAPGKQDTRPKIWRKGSPRFDTLILPLMAGATLTIARANAAWSPALIVIRAICELLVAVAGSLLLLRLAHTIPQEKRALAIALGASAVYPFVAEFAMRQFAYGSEPLELLLLTSLQLSAVVLAVFSHLPRLGGTAVLLSSFLLLFATTIASSPMTLALAGVYGALGLWWLMGAYWDRLAGTFVASRVERRIPVRISVISVTTMVLLVLGTLIGVTRSSAIALPGFMPTSGGTRWHDPHARSGVGDGDAMVAAKEEAMSFGPVQSELFLESEMPTLYDMFNDMYGEPPKPKKKQERAIALANENIQQNHLQLANNERSGREFSAIRQKVERKKQVLDDRKAPAMLYVVGRVPLHLALERYDTFDGRDWTHSGEQLKQESIRLEIQNGKPWANLTGTDSSSTQHGLETHAVKIINLKTNRFPSPPQLTAVHVDKVDQPEFFGWTEDGVACMPVREHIPQLTVLYLRSQSANRQLIREDDFTARFPEVSSKSLHQDRTAVDAQAELIARHLRVPDSTEAVPQIAAAWTLDQPRGWRQVEAIVERLRSDFTLDPLAVTPEDCPDVVSHFLQARRGPDYLFATTAAILLRELGYPTRLVTGFYADSNRYDHRAGQTAVLAEDVHVWVEVSIDGSTWVPIEPTPGYEPPRESLTWRQRVAQVWYSVCRWFGSHFALIGFSLSVAATVWFTRIHWLGVVFMWVCRIAGRIDSRRRVLWTIRLLEWRAWLSGHRRPNSKTLSQWYGALGDILPQATAASLQFALHSADSLLYGSRKSSTSITPTQELLTACAVVDQRIGTRCFRQAFANVEAGAKR